MWMRSIRSNLLALISLVVALTALSYNTWRNEHTEHNRNIRVAAFEVLRELAQLQLVIDYAHYENDLEHGNAIMGWGHVGLVNDLSVVIPEPVPTQAEKLFTVWAEEWETVQDNLESNEKVTQQIRQTRMAVLNVLSHLR